MTQLDNLYGYMSITECRQLRYQNRCLELRLGSAIVRHDDSKGIASWASLEYDKVRLGCIVCSRREKVWHYGYYMQTRAHTGTQSNFASLPDIMWQAILSSEILTKASTSNRIT